MPNSKRKKTDTAVIIAIIGLVGTIIAALFSSPVLIAMLERGTPSAQPSEALVNEAQSTNAGKVLVFSQDFEKGTISGFAFDGGEWKITSDQSNKVLEGIADASVDVWPMAFFGPADFADGVIEFKIKFNQFQNDASASFHFRYNDEATYSISMLQTNIGLGYRTGKNGWSLTPLNEKTNLPFTFENGVWYWVRVETRSDRFSIYIDNNRLFNASDNRLQRGGFVFSLAPGYKIMIDDINVWSME